jgi:hypothetical protein
MGEMPISEFCISGLVSGLPDSCQAIQISNHRIGELPVFLSHPFKSNTSPLSLISNAAPSFVPPSWSRLECRLNPGAPPSRPQGPNRSLHPALRTRHFFATELRGYSK